MPYNPNNNPYIPGDPYSYDLKWIVERLNQHKFAEESAADAKASAEAAAASAEAAELSKDETQEIADEIQRLFVTPEMFGAAGDGITDDTEPVKEALASGKNVILANEYALNENITIPEECHVSGLNFRKSKVNFAAGFGFIIGGRYVTLENLEINGTGGIGISGLVSNDIAHSMHMCNYKNLTINGFNNGIKFGTTSWCCTFENIRINNAAVGINTISSSASGMLITFINVYCNGCTKDANLYAFKCSFIGCNFGIQAFPALTIDNNSQAKFIECNFECDTHVTTTGQAMIQVLGIYASFDSCMFKINAAAGAYGFAVYTALVGLSFKNCWNVSVTGNQMPDTNYFQVGSSNTSRYGAISFDGGNAMPRPAYNDAQYPNWIDRDRSKPICFRTTNIDKTKLQIGAILYAVDYYSLCIYNGTNVVKVSDGTVIV